MKQISYILLISLQSLFFVACSSSKKVASFPIVTVALPNSEEGTILIRSSGQGQTEGNAVDNSETKAFKTLFFYGFPSSVQIRPLIENENEAKRINPIFFEDFFEKKDYKNFIVNSSTYANSQKVGNYYYLNRDIKINLRSLRNHLENKGIIRKFGY